MLVFVIAVYSQRPLRGDVCPQIPDLTTEQKQKIDKLSLAHQQSMDALRAKFYTETDVAMSLTIKSQMNTERGNHYRNISGLLTPAQQAWFDKTSSANAGRGYGRGMGHGRGMGCGRGMGYGRGIGRGR